MPSKSLIIFDLDGTLVDTQADLCRSVNYVRTEFGLSPIDDDSIANMIGNGAPRLIQAALPQRPETDVARGLQLFLDYYREHMLDESEVYPGVSETLERLGDSNLAVLTNKPYKFSRLMLERLELLGHFHTVYGGNSFERKKPDPTGVFQILSETGASPEATWMVGDSWVDVRTGKNAGVRTCGVTYGYAAHTFEAEPPDVAIDAFPQLAGIVTSVSGLSA